MSAASRWIHDSTFGEWVAPATLAAVVAAAAVPFLLGKYPFFLDFVVGPSWDPLRSGVFGFGAPAYGGSAPLLGVLSALAPPDVAWKLLLPGVLALAAGAGYVAFPGPRWARTYGALLLVVNPFVYARVLAGQWAVVWGVAALPLVLRAYADYLDDPRPRRLLFAVGAITLLSVSAHILYASALLLGLVTFFRYADRREGGVFRRSLVVVAAALPVNAYWIVPALFSGSRPLGGVSTRNALSFAPSAGPSPPLYATATMHGFWREGFVYARDLVPATEAAYAVVLFLAVYGAVASYDGERRHVVRAMVVTAVVATLLGAGLRGPAAPAFAWLYENIPLFAGMRDSNKFVALLVVAYAYLGAVGVSALLARARRVERRQVASALVLALVVLSPLVFSFPMVTGYAGQVSVGDYPSAWYEVDRQLDADSGEYNVLFLPWHRYMDYSWVEGRGQRVITPARHFFSAPVIQGDNVEVGGVYTASDDRLSGYVEFLFGLGPSREREPVPNPGELLAHANVEYVVVAKEADWRYYDAALANGSDLTPIAENEHLVVYRNERRVDRAYATSRVVPVRNWSAFAALSQRRDTTESVYVLASTGHPRAGGLDGPGREPLAVEERSPVDYRVEGSGRRHAVFARPQRARAAGWRYDGKRPARLHLGFQPAFESAPEAATVRYGPFYGLFLPSYVASAVAALAVLAYAGAGGALARRWGWNRLRSWWNGVRPRRRDETIQESDE